VNQFLVSSLWFLDKAKSVAADEHAGRFLCVSPDYLCTSFSLIRTSNTKSTAPKNPKNSASGNIQDSGGIDRLPRIHHATDSAKNELTVEMKNPAAANLNLISPVGFFILILLC
jgi:hypothetical protein